MADLLEISRSHHGRPARRASAPNGGPLDGLPRKFLMMLSRHRILFAAGCAASLALAVAAGMRFATATWEADGTLLYTPLTGPESNGMYTPPDLKTLVALAKSPGNLRDLQKEFQLKVPADLLDRLFKVSVPTGTKMVEFQLKWAEPRQSSEMVNRLMEVFRDQVAGLRRAKLDDYIADIAIHDEACQARARAADEALDRFSRREKTGDVAKDLVRLNQEIQVLEAEADRTTRAEADLMAQRQKMVEHMEAMKALAKAEPSPDDKGVEAAEETMDVNRRRQERLRELIEGERMKAVVRAKLVAKEADYERTLKLARQGVTSRTAVEEARSEVEALKAQLVESDDIRQWRGELERLDKVVVPKGASKTKSTANVDHTQFKQLEIDLDLTSNRTESAQLKTALEAKRREADRLMGLQQQYRALAAAADAAEGERREVQTELSALRQLRAIKTQEFSIVTPATPGPYPVSSNKKMLVLGGTAGGLVLTLGLLLLVDTVLWPRADASETAWKLGLPILGRLAPPALASSTSPGALDDPTLRLLALRLRQAIDRSTGLVLFSTMNREIGSAWLVEALARCFARREERVLILDLAGHPDDRASWEAICPEDRGDGEVPGARTGLHAYLVFEIDDLDGFVQPTRFPGVDCMPAGDLLYHVELLATPRMTRLVQAVRSRYSMILAVGPRADCQVDLELLAPHADGIVFHAIDRADMCPVDPTRVRNLADVGTPILGTVISSGPVSAWTRDDPPTEGLPSRPRAVLGLSRS